ncbi:MAG: long-chain fatty acid--CoA ligase [Deltaproteobacteria bacterium]|nr:MAG: long-chain fatty acid--CoA ligase [Deltaproteobacteria bacterium]
MNIVDIVVKNARMYPHDIAFVEVRPATKVRKEITWSQFNERTDKLANALIHRGIGKGKKVLLLGRNSINWLEAYFAVMKSGAWVAPLNYRFKDDDIEYCANVAEPSAFILDEEFAERMNAIRSKLQTVKNFICVGHGHHEGMENMEDIVKKSSSESPKVELKDEEECALYFTSGTTGAPKPVLLVHKNLMCAALAEAINHYWKHNDSLLMIPPLYHLAIGHLLGCMIVGGRAVLLTEQVSPQYIIETISKERISVVFLLVPWALDILEVLDRGELNKEDYGLSCWRLTHMGAQPIPPSLVQRLKRHFPQMQYDTNYGLSESAGPGVIHLGIENERKVGAIGKPALMWDARIVNDEGEDVPRGEVGELIVKGGGIMKEYYKNPELTAKTIRNGWLYTGDLAKMDEEGFIYLVDRKKDLVISGGENVYPVEVEEIIQRHPKVHDVAVIGTPDERLGEIVTAIIEPINGETLTEDEIILFCEQNLPRYKRPRRIIFDHVPRSSTGKIEKPKLRQKYGKSE